MNDLHLTSKKLPTLKQVQCFLAVIYEGSFRAAATSLHMTQPPLSRHIKNLEELLGEKLFVRSTIGFEITIYGTSFQKVAENYLKRLSEDLQSIEHLKKPSHPTIKVALTRNLYFNEKQWFKEIFQQNKDIDLINSKSSKEIIESVANGDIQIGIIGEIPKNLPDLSFTFFYKENVCAAITEGLLKKSVENITLSHLENMNLFWFNRLQNKAYYDKCEHVFLSKGFNHSKILESVDSLQNLFNIAKGQGFTFLPESNCYLKVDGIEYKSLSTDLSDSLSIDTYLVVSKNMLNIESSHLYERLKSYRT